MAMNIPAPVQILRATQAEIAERTGANGELNWAEDTHELYIHDGVTKGGHLIAGGGGGSYSAGAGVKISDDGVISVHLDDTFATVESNISNGIIGRSDIFAGNLDTLDSGYSNIRRYYKIDSFATGSKPFRNISFILADLGLSQVAIAEGKIAVRSRSSTNNPWPEWVMVGGTSVTAGDGISITDDAVAVDDTVVRTTGNQTIEGTLQLVDGPSVTEPILAVRSASGSLRTEVNTHEILFRNDDDDYVRFDFGGTSGALPDTTNGSIAAYNGPTGSFAHLSVIAGEKGEYAIAPSTRSTPVANEIITYNFLSTRYLPISGGTLTGGLFGTSVALSESIIDVSLGSCFTKTITAATTFAFTGVPSNATARFSLVLTNGGSQTVTWPSSVKWSGGANPELAASGVDVFTFLTADGGTTWYGVHSVQGAA